MGYSIDGANKVITLTAGTVAVSVRDLWSRWIDWQAQGDNAKYLPALATVGGDDIDAAAGTKIPIYAFLLNGWKIRPQEASHTLSVGDGVLLVSGGGDPFLNTLGSFVVRVNYQQPVQAIAFSTGGGATLTPAQVWQAHDAEAGLSPEGMLRLILSAVSGKLAIAGDTVATRDVADTKDRLSVLTDADGRRLGVTRDAS